MLTSSFLDAICCCTGFWWHCWTLSLRGSSVSQLIWKHPSHFSFGKIIANKNNGKNNNSNDLEDKRDNGQRPRAALYYILELLSGHRFPTTNRAREWNPEKGRNPNTQKRRDKRSEPRYTETRKTEEDNDVSQQDWIRKKEEGRIDGHYWTVLKPTRIYLIDI